MQAGGGLIWADGSYADPYRMDEWRTVLSAVSPATGRVVRRIEVPDGDHALVAVDGTVYLSGSRHAALTEIAPDGHTTDYPLTRPLDDLLTVTPGAVWALTNTGEVERISMPTRRAGAALDRS